MSGSVTSFSEHRQTSPEADVRSGPVLYFDGVCGLCNRTVDFVMRHDAAGQIRFAPLQGETAAANLTPEDVANLNSMVLSTEQGTFRRSAAAVRILWRLGGVWRVCGGLLWLIPLPLRDLGYSVIAATRYRLFGKHDSCRLPTPEQRERFLP